MCSTSAIQNAQGRLFHFVQLTFVMCFRSVYVRTRNRYLRCTPITQSTNNKEKEEPRRTVVRWKQNNREREGVLWHLWYDNVKGKACLSTFCLSLFLAFIHYLHNPTKQYFCGGYLHLNNGYPVPEAWYSRKSKQLVLFSCKEPPKPYCIMGLCSIVTLAFSWSRVWDKNEIRYSFILVTRLILGSVHMIPVSGLCDNTATQFFHRTKYSHHRVPSATPGIYPIKWHFNWLTFAFVVECQLH